MKKVVIRIAEVSDLAQIQRLMEEITENLSDKELFYADDKDFIEKHISQCGFILTAMADGQMAGFLMIRIPQKDEDNLGYDILLPEEELHKVAHMESIGVLPEFRGYGIQKKLIIEAETILSKKGFKWFMATVSPKNEKSLHNFLEIGYEIGSTKIKYGGLERYILFKNYQKQ